MKSIPINTRWFLLVVFVLFNVHYNQRVAAQNKTAEDTNSLYLLVADTSFRWHPEAIYVMLPGMKFEFKLPQEKDQSGVHNLLFQSKETGKIYLLDTIKVVEYKTYLVDTIYIRHPGKIYRLDTIKGMYPYKFCLLVSGNYRFYNKDLTSGKFDAILLYNNGKYIRYNDVFFEQNNDSEVDMEQLDIQPSDSISQYWLTLRAFNTALGTRKLPEDFVPDSGGKIRGYIFTEDGIATGASICRLDDRGGIKSGVASQSDGYFEINDDLFQPLRVRFLGVESQDIKIKPNSGLFLVTKNEKFTVPENLTTGSNPMSSNKIER